MANPIRLDPFQTVVQLDLIKTISWWNSVWAVPMPDQTRTDYTLLIYYKSEADGRAAVWLDDGPIFSAFHRAMQKLVAYDTYPSPSSWLNDIGKHIRYNITSAMRSKGFVSWRWDDSIRPDNYQTPCEVFTRYGHTNALRWSSTAPFDVEARTTCHYTFPGVFRVTKDGVKRFTVNYMPIWVASECSKDALRRRYNREPNSSWNASMQILVEQHVTDIGGIWGGGCTNWETTP